MLSEKSVLLEQISTTIKKNSCKKNTECDSNLRIGNDSEENETLLSDENYFSYTRSLKSIKKLEERIEALEDQNDHLLYFIHYLYKNFHEMVREILPYDDHNTNKFGVLTESSESLTEVKKGHYPSLTPREIEILHLLVKGLCAKEIATLLFISETTVITHKKNLKKKFCAKNSVELISKAFLILCRTNIPDFNY